MKPTEDDAIISTEQARSKLIKMSGRLPDVRPAKPAAVRRAPSLEDQPPTVNMDS